MARLNELLVEDNQALNRRLESLARNILGDKAYEKLHKEIDGMDSDALMKKIQAIKI